MLLILEWEGHKTTESLYHVTCGISKITVSQKGNPFQVRQGENVFFQYRFDWWVAIQVQEITAEFQPKY